MAAQKATVTKIIADQKAALAEYGRIGNCNKAAQAQAEAEADTWAAACVAAEAEAREAAEDTGAAAVGQQQEAAAEAAGTLAEAAGLPHEHGALCMELQLPGAEATPGQWEQAEQGLLPLAAECGRRALCGPLEREYQAVQQRLLDFEELQGALTAKEYNTMRAPKLARLRRSWPRSQVRMHPLQ